jgi:CRP/FNR family cyclic AMP-dependent transcriptional regulator
METVSKKNIIGTGKRILSRYEHFHHRGTLLFIEGEPSTEMYIIRSGKVRILKQEGENTVELATLGPGSVLGELSLLDHQPRSATAQVIEDTVVTIIDEELFTRTLQQIPSWFGNIIQLVVKRLRDTMRKNSEDIIKKNIAGVIRVLLLVIENNGTTANEKNSLLLQKVKETVFAVIGLGGIELESIFLHLILKEMAVIRKNQMGIEYITVKDTGVLELYMNYLRAKQAGLSLTGDKFKDKTYDFINTVLIAGERNGSAIGSNLIKVGLPQIELELERQGKDRGIDPDVLDQLVNAKLIIKQEDVTESINGKHKRIALIYSPETMKKIQMLRLWLPVFKEEISF